MFYNLAQSKVTSSKGLTVFNFLVHEAKTETSDLPSEELEPESLKQFSQIFHLKKDTKQKDKSISFSGSFQLQQQLFASGTKPADREIESWSVNSANTGNR